MIEVHVSALEAFLYALSLIVVLFALGYFSSLVDRTKGFTKEEAKKTEEQIRRMIGEVYGEINDDTVHGIPQNGVQLRPENATQGSSR